MHHRRIYHPCAGWIWASSPFASSPATVGLVSGSCSSARIFAPRFFRAPPHRECSFTLALRYPFTPLTVLRGLASFRFLQPPHRGGPSSKLSNMLGTRKTALSMTAEGWLAKSSGEEGI